MKDRLVALLRSLWKQASSLGMLNVCFEAFVGKHLTQVVCNRQSLELPC